MDKERLAELYRFDFDAGLILSRLKEKPVGSKNKSGHITLSVDGKKLYAHRILFFMAHGYLPDLIDHINCDPSDNKISNLRALSHKENLLNRKNAKGVYFNKANKKWIAQISNKYLGSFASEEKALGVRNKAIKNIFENK